MSAITETPIRHAELSAFIATLGLTYTAEFVPASKDPDKWENETEVPCAHWKITLAKDEYCSLTTSYKVGWGNYFPHPYRHRPSADLMHRVISAMEKGKIENYPEKMFPRYTPLPAPSLLDVLYSLQADADVLNFSGFENWANTFGFDTDSIKAEKTYRACIEIALKLRALIGDTNLSRLSELYQDY